MRFMKLAAIGAGMAMMPTVADAALVGNLGRGTGSFLDLSNAGLNGGSVATLAGGGVFTADREFADIPAGEVFGNTFLAAGVRAGQPALLTFTTPVTYLSFLWGSPDTFNRLLLTTSATTYAFDVANLGFAVRDGNQSFSQYVQFTATAGETIRSVSFLNNPATDAFEAANFSISAVPEAGTWAMMMVGFAMVGGAARYRRRGAKITYA